MRRGEEGWKDGRREMIFSFCVQKDNTKIGHLAADSGFDGQQSVARILCGEGEVLALDHELRDQLHVLVRGLSNLCAMDRFVNVHDSLIDHTKGKLSSEERLSDVDDKGGSILVTTFLHLADLHLCI